MQWYRGIKEDEKDGQKDWHKGNETGLAIGLDRSITSETPSSSYSTSSCGSCTVSLQGIIILYLGHISSLYSILSDAHPLFSHQKDRWSALRDSVSVKKAHTPAEKESLLTVRQEECAKSLMITNTSCNRAHSTCVSSNRRLEIDNQRRGEKNECLRS